MGPGWPGNHLVSLCSLAGRLADVQPAVTLTTRSLCPTVAEAMNDAMLRSSQLLLLREAAAADGASSAEPAPATILTAASLVAGDTRATGPAPQACVA